MQPISKKLEIQFRGPSSSGEINQWADDLYYDLMQLFNAEARHEKEITSNLEMLIVENVMLQDKIRKLEALFADIEETMDKSETTQSKVLTKLFTSDTDITTITNTKLGPEYNTKLDPEYNVLMLPTASPETSRLYLYNIDGENLIPTQLACRLYEHTEPFEEVDASMIVAETDDLRSVVDGDPCSFFLRRSERDTTTNAVYFCLELDLPANIVTHQRANAIGIIPTPLGSMSLLNITYRTQQDWIRLPSYPQVEQGGKLSPAEINDLGKELFCFPSRDVQSIRIYGKQSNWFAEGDQRIFYYGFRGLEVNYLSFIPEIIDNESEERGSRARAKFIIPDESRQFVIIEDVVPLFAVGSVKPTAVESVEDYIKVNYIYANNRKYALGETLPMGTKEIEVDFTIMPVNEISPLITGLKIEYQSA